MRNLTLKIKNLLKNPNFWTFLRVAAIPLIIFLLQYPNPWSAFFSALIFSLAAISDYLDGFLARREGLVSNFGKMMDPLADKFLVSATLIMLTSVGWVSGWMVCVIVFREIAVTGLRGIIVEKGEDVSASDLGKYKTGFQIAAIIPLLLHYSYLGIDFSIVGESVLWIALVFTIWSGADYFIRFNQYMR